MAACDVGAADRTGVEMSAKWRGIAEARKAFAKLPEVARAAANKSVDDSRKAVVADAKARVPVLTGALKKSIGSRQDKRRAKATVFAKAPHAHLVEFGTVHSAAKPFMLPAAEAERGNFEGRARSIAQEIEREMEIKS